MFDPDFRSFSNVTRIGGARIVHDSVLILWLLTVLPAEREH